MNVLSRFKDWENVQQYGAGDVVFTRRDPADAIFLILSGEVELQLHGDSLCIEREGALIGVTAMFGAESRSGTATARSDVKLAQLNPGELRELMIKDSDFALHVMAGLANRLRAVDAYISTHIEHKS